MGTATKCLEPVILILTPTRLDEEYGIKGFSQELLFGVAAKKNRNGGYLFFKVAVPGFHFQSLPLMDSPPFSNATCRVVRPAVRTIY